MTSPQRLPASLTPLDMALAALLTGSEPVTPMELPLAEALRCIAAEMPPLPALPPHDIAAARRLCVLRAAISSARPRIRRCRWRRRRPGSKPATPCLTAATACSMPIPSICRARCRRCWRKRSRGRACGGPAATLPRAVASLEAGRRVLARDLLIARAAGIERLRVRRPRLRIVNVPGGAVTADLIAESARTAGADMSSVTEAAGRDAASIAAALDRRVRPADARSAAAASAAPMPR